MSCPALVDEDGIGGYGEWGQVPDDVVAELAHRTPGFNVSQEAQWWTHCGDAGQFLGPAAREESGRAMGEWP